MPKRPRLYRILNLFLVTNFITKFTTNLKHKLESKVYMNLKEYHFGVINDYSYAKEGLFELNSFRDKKRKNAATSNSLIIKNI